MITYSTNLGVMGNVQKEKKTLGLLQKTQISLL